MGMTAGCLPASGYRLRNLCSRPCGRHHHVRLWRQVIKIERPGGGDLWRLFSKLPGTAKSELDLVLGLTSRNKKSVALDLGRPEGREALIRLVRTSDVFLTNYQRTRSKNFISPGKTWHLSTTG